MLPWTLLTLAALAGLLVAEAPGVRPPAFVGKLLSWIGDVLLAASVAC